MAEKVLNIIFLNFIVLLFACTPMQDAQGEKTKSSSNPYEMAGDHTLGNPDAEVTIIEYASLTCSHCAHFHETVWPHLKKKYVDTDKVYFILRLFPTPPEQVSIAESMIAECTGEKEFFFKAVDLFMDRQEAIFEEGKKGNFREPLLSIARGLGLNEKEVDACFENEEVQKRFTKKVEKAQKKHKITGTPSFVINGELKQYIDLNNGIESFEKVLLPYFNKKNP